jgi:hypothetical protein
MKIIALLLVISNFSLSGCWCSADLATNSNNSSKPATTEQKPTSETRAQPNPTAASTERREPSANFTNHRVFAARLQKVDQVRLFEGLPHQEFALELFEQELRTKKTVTFYGFLFYEEPVELKKADVTVLTRFFRNPKSFKRYWGPKACGGFHPDYGIEWQVAQEIYHALICFTCGETRLFGPKLELYCDIAEKNGAASLLWNLLEPYHHNRPGPRRH